MRRRGFRKALHRSIGRAKVALEEEKVDHAETKERNRLLMEELQAIKLTTAYHDQEKSERARAKMQERINCLVQAGVKHSWESRSRSLFRIEAIA